MSKRYKVFEATKKNVMSLIVSTTRRRKEFKIPLSLLATIWKQFNIVTTMDTLKSAIFLF